MKIKMPYTHDINNIKLVGLQDRRRKLTDEQKAEIIRLRDEGWSMRKLAKEYGRDNWRKFQKAKEKNAEAVRKTRLYKQELFLKGELK